MIFLNAPRLALLAMDLDLARLQASSRTAFFNAIAVVHAPTWPPEPFGDQAIQWMLDNLSCDPEGEGWYGWVLLANEGEHAPPLIIGGAGLIGRPDEDGDVELAIAVRPEFSGRDYERSAVKALAQWALANGAKRVLTHFDSEQESAARLFMESGFLDTCDPPYPGVARWALSASVEA